MSLLQVNRVSRDSSLYLICVLDSFERVEHRIEPLSLSEDPFHPTLDLVIDLLRVPTIVHTLMLSFNYILHSLFDICVFLDYPMMSDRAPWLSRELRKCRQIYLYLTQLPSAHECFWSDKATTTQMCAWYGRGIVGDAHLNIF